MIYVFSVNLAATKTCKNVGSKRVVIGSFHAIRHTLLLWIFRWHPPARDKANNVKIDSCRKFVVSGCIWPKKSKPSHGEKIPNFWSHGLRTSVGAMQLSERTHLLVPFSKTYCNGDQWKSKWSTSEQNWRTYPKVFWSGWSFQNGNHRGRFKGGGNSFFFHFHPWVKWSILTSILVQDASRELVVYARHFTERLRNMPEAGNPWNSPKKCTGWHGTAQAWKNETPHFIGSMGLVYLPGHGKKVKATWKVSSLHLWQNDLIQFDPMNEENSNSKAARKPKLLDFVLCFRQWYLGVVGPRKKKHDDGTHLMIPPGVTHSDMFRGRNLFKMVDQYKVSWLLHEISRSTCVIFPLVHQRCCNTSLRVGSTGSVVRPILWTNGMMLGSWVFRWHTEKRRWFSDGFWTNYKNLNRPHVKMCFRKGNLPKHGLNLS